MLFLQLRQVRQAYLRVSLISNNQQFSKTNKKLEHFQHTQQQLWAPSIASLCRRFYSHNSKINVHWKYLKVNSCLNSRQSVSKKCKPRWSKPWLSFSTRSVKCLWSSRLSSPALRPRWANRHRSRDLPHSSIHQRKSCIVILSTCQSVSSYHKPFRHIWPTKRLLSSLKIKSHRHKTS